jgi:hypothetical protein
MYLYKCTHTHTHTHTCIQICGWGRSKGGLGELFSTPTSAYTHETKKAHVRMWTHVCKRIYIYIYIYILLHTDMNIYIYIYTHTNIRTLTVSRVKTHTCTQICLYTCTIFRVKRPRPWRTCLCTNTCMRRYSITVSWRSLWALRRGIKVPWKCVWILHRKIKLREVGLNNYGIFWKIHTYCILYCTNLPCIPMF